MRPTPIPARQPDVRRQIVLAGLAIAAAAFAAYSNSFRGPFVFDDGGAVLDNPTIRHWWNPIEVLSPPTDTTVSGRPVANATLALNFAISGLHVWSYHLLNLAIHIAAGLALFGVTRRTLARPPLARRFGTASLPLAFAISLLWVLHPLQTESVTYVIQRVESLMGLFFLLTFYCLLRAEEEPGSRRWKIGAVAACLLGMGTKEVMATAPVLAFFFDRTFIAGSFAEAWRRRWKLHLAMAATWLPLAWLVATTGGNRSGTSGFDVGVSPVAYWLTQFEAVVRYLVLSAWPHPLVFEYGTRWVHGFREIAPYAATVVALAAGTLLALWRRPVIGFLGGWFFAILAPTSVIPGTIQMIVEHRMYLPLAAITALVGAAAYRLAGRFWLTGCLGTALGLGLMTYQRNEVYLTEQALWSDTLRHAPDNDRAHNNLGNALIDASLAAEAIPHYEAALRIKPDYVEAHSNLGNAYLQVGRATEAIAQCRAALRIAPHYAKGHNNLGNALLETGHVQEAVGHYKIALRLAPGDPKTHYNYGNALLQQGRLAEAAQEYETSLRLKPNEPEAHYNLGNACLQSGRVNDAIQHYQMALGLKPGYVEAHSNLGNAYLQLEQIPAAITEFEAALRIRPNYAEGHNNLGAALFRAGRLREAIGEVEAALQIRPGYPDARRNLEWMRSQLPAAR